MFTCTRAPISVAQFFLFCTRSTSSVSTSTRHQLKRIQKPPFQRNGAVYLSLTGSLRNIFFGAKFAMSAFSKETVITIGAGAAAALILATTWCRYKQRRNNRIPKKWIEIGTVDELTIYPLKSGGGKNVEQFECTKTGPILLQEGKLVLRDRCFLIYKEKDGEFRHAGHYPKMVLISLEAVNEKEVKLSAPDMNPVIVDTSALSPKSVKCKLWYNEPAECVDCGDEAAEWVSRKLIEKNSGLRLGMCTNWKRNLYWGGWNSWIEIYKNMRNEDLGIYSDFSSYMMCNRASLEDLSEKLSAEASSLRFRPNITVNGPEAFAEDDWEWIKIGDETVFRSYKPCTRCSRVNVDPKTGIMEQKVLQRLKQYRQVKEEKQRAVEGDSPVMGFYAGIYKLGSVKLGDKVYVG